MFNSVKLYERAFKPIEGGYLYYPHRWSRGFLVRPEERERLVEDFRRLTSFSTTFKIVAFATICAVIQVALADSFGVSEAANSAMTLGIALAIVVYFLWKSTAAYRLIRRREPVAPKRRSRDAESDMADKLSWPMMLFVLALSLWFTFLCLLAALANPLVGIPLSALFGVATFMNARIAFRKWAAGRAKT